MIKTPYCDTGEGAQGLVGVHTVEDICISTMMEYIVSSLLIQGVEVYIYSRLQAHSGATNTDIICLDQLNFHKKHILTGSLPNIVVLFHIAQRFHTPPQGITYLCQMHAGQHWGRIVHQLPTVYR